MNNSNFFPLERNRYFYGKMLTARDFETEQRYFNNKRRLLNRTLYGAGVVCGLGVYRNDDVSFSVETGMALDYMGREICVSAPVIRKLRMSRAARALRNPTARTSACNTHRRTANRSTTSARRTAPASSSTK